jgi:hypothetical protein
MLRRAFSFLGVTLLLLPPAARAQQVDCNVKVDLQALSNTYADRLKDLNLALQEYVGNYNWGLSNATDKVKCEMTVFIKSAIAENRFVAQVAIVSQRRIYKSDQSTPVLRLFDEYWEFEYLKTSPLVHNPYVFNQLTSFLDFYMYLVVGMDYDTYDRVSGTPMLQKAYEVANLGRSAGKQEWQVSTSTYNRMQYIEELLNPKFEPVRTASWIYYFTGLDSLAFDKQRGQRNMLSAIELIGTAKKQVDPRNLVIKVFFDTKYQEIAERFSDYPDPSVYVTIGRVDQANLKTYESYRMRNR